MALRDMVSKILVKQSLLPAVRVSGTVNGTTIDLRGFDAAAVSVVFGAYTDGVHTPSLQHSTDGTNFTTVSADLLNGAFAAVNGAAGAGSVQTVGYMGNQRYVRVVMTVTGATTGAASAAMIVTGYSRQAPAM